MSHGGEEPVDGIPAVSDLSAGIYPGVWKEVGYDPCWWMEEEMVGGSLFDMPEWVEENENGIM